jgi:hypothetical protein
MPLSALEITAIGAVVGVVSTNAVAWAKLFSDRKKSGNNGSGNGDGKPCPLHPDLVSRTVRIEAKTEHLRSDLSTAHTEDRQDHDKIFTQLGALSVSVALAGEKADAAQKAAVITADKVERQIIQIADGGRS